MFGAAAWTFPFLNKEFQYEYGDKSVEKLYTVNNRYRVNRTSS